jgi:hypothetical protein
MLQAPGTLHRLLTAFRAPLVSLHSQLVFALPGDWQIRELIFDAFSHFCSVSNRHLQLSGFIFTIDRPNSARFVRFYFAVTGLLYPYEGVRWQNPGLALLWLSFSQRTIGRA